MQLLGYFRCKSELDENVNLSLNSKRDLMSLFGVFSLVLVFRRERILKCSPRISLTFLPPTAECKPGDEN